jgi:hypothetical protein
MNDDLNLVHEQLNAEGRWQRSFWSPELQGAYEMGQATARDGSACERLRDSSWQTSARVVSAYWLGYLSSMKDMEIRLPSDVRDLPGLAQYLHREAAWTATGVAHDGDGRPADLEAVLDFTVAMVYERIARLVDQLIVGHPEEAAAIWMPVDAKDDVMDAGDGMAFTLASDPSGEGVRIRVDGGEDCNAERRVATWWEAHAALGGLLHALDVAHLRNSSNTGGERNST